METLGLAWEAARCLSRNKGATTFKGKSRTVPSWLEVTAGTAGLTHARMLFQVKQIRPCLSACSMADAGSPTLASARPRLMISLRTSSGQPSARDPRETTSGSTAPDLSAAGLGAGGEAGAGEAGRGAGAGALATGAAEAGGLTVALGVKGMGLAAAAATAGAGVGSIGEIGLARSGLGTKEIGLAAGADGCCGARFLKPEPGAGAVGIEKRAAGAAGATSAAGAAGTAVMEARG